MREANSMFRHPSSPCKNCNLILEGIKALERADWPRLTLVA
jgi:hypothetical protein